MTPLAEPAPYDFPDLVVWSFEIGVGGRSAPGFAALAALETAEERVAFASGVLVGVAQGARERVASEVQSTVELVIETVRWVYRSYSAVYDPVLLERLLGALAAAPGSVEEARALREMAAHLDRQHPALSEALTVLADVQPLLEAFVDWIQEASAVRTLLLALAEDFGDLLGDVLGEAANLTGRPTEQGIAVGDPIGRFCAEVALMCLGWSVARKNLRLRGASRDRAASSRVAAVIHHELGARANPKRVKGALRGLDNRTLLRSVANRPAERLASLLAELPQLAAEQGSRRRGRYGHLFDPQGPGATHERAIRGLRRLVDSGEAKRLLKTAEGRQLLESRARVLYGELSGVAERYGSLKDETGLYNDLVALLEPRRYDELSLDAHHPIEQKTFARFEKDWRLLGWASTNDMPAIPVHYLPHRRSPRELRGRLRDVSKTAEAIKAQSLSADLRKHIKPDRMKDAAELLRAYRAFYASSIRLRSALPVIKAVETELARRRSLARLAAEAAKR